MKPSIPVGSCQTEISVRAYDGARLVWRRERGEIDWGPWVLVKVQPRS